MEFNTTNYLTALMSMKGTTNGSVDITMGLAEESRFSSR
jgi:hypothetical protein